MSDKVKERLRLFKPDVVSWLLLILIFALPTFSITSYLYGFPFKKIYIDLADSKKEYAVFPHAEQGLVRSFFGRVLQTSLSLDWYDVCLNNSNFFTVNGKRLDNQKLLKDDPEAGAMQLNFDSSDELIVTSTTTNALYVPIGDSKCMTVSLGSKPKIELKGISIRSPESYTVETTVKVNKDGIKVGPIESPSLYSDTHSAYIQNNLLAWTIKFLIIFGLWSTFILFIKKLLHFTNPD